MTSSPTTPTYPTTTTEVITSTTSHTSTPATPTYTPVPSASNSCGIVPDANHHVVQKGETLYRISKMYHVSIDDLKRWNHIGRNNIIKVCSQLKISNNNSVASYSYSSKGEIATPTTTISTPTPSIVAATAVPKSYNYISTNNSPKLHTVKKGETLYRLSKKYGIDIPTLKSINGLSSNIISIGQVLHVSKNTTSSSSIDIPKSYDITPKSTFTAKGGTVTSAPTVKWDAVPKAVKIPESYSNNFTAKGAIDIIPQKGIRNIHIVQDNETIFSIAKMYNRTVEQLNKINKLNKNEVIIPGQKLYLD